MLRIRLRRVGKKGKPSYRIVVADANAPRDGAYVEWIGNYDPMADPPAISLKKDRAIQWLSQGAQPSDAVRRILDRDGILVRTPKFRAHREAPEAPEGTLAPAVTITRGPAPATAEEDTEVPEEAVGEESAEEVIDQEASIDAPEEAVGEESAEEVIDQEASIDAPEEAVGEESAEEVIDQEASIDAPEEAVGEESAEEVIDQEASIDAPKEAVGEESVEEVIDQEAPSDAPEDETGEEARSE